MITLACFVAASLLLGIFFNAYALIVLCAIATLANLASVAIIGVYPAAIAAVADLIVIQIGYFAGLSASALLPASKPASIPTSRT